VLEITSRRIISSAFLRPIRGTLVPRFLLFTDIGCRLYKNLHETLETLDTFPCLKGMTPHSTVSESQLSHIIFLHGDIDNFGDIANIATFASAFFSFVNCVGMLFRHLFTTPREGRIVSDSLEIPWWFVGCYATHYVPKQEAKAS